MIDKRREHLISVVVVNYNGTDHLRKCLSGLVNQTYQPFEILVVDNCSDQPPYSVMKGYPQIRLVRAKKNYGYGGACNLGMKKSSGELVVFLNNDTFAPPEWLELMTTTMNDHPDAAIIGCKVIQMDNKLIDSAGAIIEYPSGVSYARGYLEQDVGDYDKTIEIAAIGGAAFMVRRDAYKLIGGFDSSFFLYYDEIHLCWTARLAGYKVIYTPHATILHFGSYGLGKRSPEKIRYEERNRTLAMIALLKPRNLLTFLAFEFADTMLVLLGIMVYRKYAAFGLAKLKGLLQSVPRLSHAYRERKRIQHLRKVSDDEIFHLHKRQTLFSSAMRYFQTASSQSGALFARDGYGSIDDR
jgi:GT2 family glycosyltransferase